MIKYLDFQFTMYKNTYEVSNLPGFYSIGVKRTFTDILAFSLIFEVSVNGTVSGLGCFILKWAKERKKKENRI